MVCTSILVCGQLAIFEKFAYEFSAYDLFYIEYSGTYCQCMDRN